MTFVDLSQYQQFRGFYYHKIVVPICGMSLNQAI